MLNDIGAPAPLLGLSVLLVAHSARADRNRILVLDNGACTVEYEHGIETDMRPPAAHGAIAVWDTSDRWQSRADAERIALRTYAPHGNGCEVRK